MKSDSEKAVKGTVVNQALALNLSLEITFTVRSSKWRNFFKRKKIENSLGIKILIFVIKKLLSSLVVCVQTADAST